MSQGPQHNPFAVPATRVEDVHFASSGNLASEPRQVPAGNGTAWIAGGWTMFKRAPGTWIGIYVALMVIMFALSMVPLVNLIANLLFPVFMGGIALGCKALDDGDEIQFSHLFAGFQNNVGQLAMVGVLYLAGMVAIGAVVAVLAAVFIGAGMSAGLSALPVLGTALVVLIGVLLAFPLGMAMWFAPTLVILGGVPAWDAIKLSFTGSLRNIMPFLLYSLVLLVLGVLAIIPAMLGTLVLGPVVFGSIYMAYRDIYLEP
ncbi:MAG: hypothetical protein KF778_02575 [Rhodocyclaceae bacterium]|nr:hypothetical protein [Rhodocyclaceae bacterium]MBX3667261.1 hypothetical protein [Rhodocyclaceae bacterium]